MWTRSLCVRSFVRVCVRACLRVDNDSTKVGRHFPYKFHWKQLWTTVVQLSICFHLFVWFILFFFPYFLYCVAWYLKFPTGQMLNDGKKKKILPLISRLSLRCLKGCLSEWFGVFEHVAVCCCCWVLISILFKTFISFPFFPFAYFKCHNLQALFFSITICCCLLLLFLYIYWSISIHIKCSSVYKWFWLH